MVFFRYLRSRIYAILITVTALAATAAVFWLYSVPFGAVRYGYILAVAILIVGAAFDMARFAGKHKMLAAYKDGGELPEPSTQIERDYTEIIDRLGEDKKRISSEADAEITEMNDCYTLWAHQIKTPISAMSLLLQTETGKNTPQLREELFNIERYVELLLQNVRLGRGGSDLRFRRYGLDGIIKQSVRKYAHIFIRKKIALDYNESGVSVLTDEKWLVFMLGQLLSNALKYTAEGGCIRIAVEQNSLVIEDNGVGIEADDIPRVFEKGFTGFNGRMDKSSTGLGLYLCKKTADRLSCRLELRSAGGRGTRATVAFADENLSKM